MDGLRRRASPFSVTDTGRAIAPPTSATGCSIRSSRRSRAAAGWGSPSSIAPSTRIAAWSSRHGPRARASPSSCRAVPRRASSPIDPRASRRAARDRTDRSLIVDDEPGILESLGILLRNEGFTPHLAHGGKAGLERIAELESRHRAHRRPHAGRGRRGDSRRRAPAERSGRAGHPHDGAGHAAVGDAGGERRAPSTTSRSRSATTSCWRSSGAPPSIASCASRTGR